MPIFSLDALTTPLTRDEVQAKIYDVLGLVGTRTTSWKPGSVVRTIITASSLMLSAFSELTALIARSGFLELAEGRWLALVAWHVYGVEKQGATFATGEVVLSNAGGGIYLLDPGDLIVSNPDTGKTYRNVEPIDLAALITLPGVLVEANEAGSASSSAPNTVVELVTPLLGVSVFNPLAIVGRDAEEDPALRARCSEKLGALSPMGPWDAYAYAARTATRADGSLIGVTRVRVAKGTGNGVLSIYVATPTGGVTGTVGNLDTDLGVIDEAIQQRAAPLAVTANVASTQAVAINVAYRLWLYNTSGLTAAQIEEAIAARLVAFMSAQPIGGNVAGAEGMLYVDALRTAIGSAVPQIFHVTLSEPAEDVVLAISAVPVLGSVTATAIAQIPPTEGSLS
jgi:phage-related baseplate assembly protein